MIKKGATVVQGASTLLGKAAKLLTPGSTDLSGVRGNVSITSSDPQIFGQALQAIQNNSAGFTSSLTQLLDASNKNQDKTLAQLTPLAESKQTDGASGQNKSVLTIAGLAIAAILFLAFLILRRR